MMFKNLEHCYAFTVSNEVEFLKVNDLIITGVNMPLIFHVFPFTLKWYYWCSHKHTHIQQKETAFNLK